MGSVPLTGPALAAAAMATLPAMGAASGEISARVEASVLSESQKKKVNWVQHRLVRAHPHTGVKSLYAVSGSSFGIEGMADAEALALALLDELKSLATQPRYCHTHTYSVGDVIVWDNAQLLHSAPLIDLSQPRTLWRITVKEAG